MLTLRLGATESMTGISEEVEAADVGLFRDLGDDGDFGEVLLSLSAPLLRIALPLFMVFGLSGVEVRGEVNGISRDIRGDLCAFVEKMPGGLYDARLSEVP